MTRTAVRRFLLVVIGAMAAACHQLTDPIPPSEQRLLIHAVLDLGTRRQVISVRRTGANLSPFGEDVFGATVSITGPDGVAMTALETPRNNTRRFANYVLDLDAYGATLVPGGVYSLRVLTTVGEQATGTTTVPGVGPANFDSTNVPTFTYIRDTLRLDWPRVLGAKSYEVSIVGRQHLGVEVLEILRYSTFVDTSLSLPGTMRWFDEDRVFVASDTITVLVAAVDDNYYTFYHVFVDPFAGAPPTRLTGAIGVFGSLVPLIRQRYYVEFF